ncbi:uncharacterized protein LOC135161382 isoform X3 [Diachasmimorpha longicaudata]|uniref:uncharacterized protein LOC135161382 isoform X3 n=1 Tax=Diachasmimorpha longicaudata TaxID=58733 RepID=UPI0030B8C8C1
MRRRREPLAFMLPRIVLQCGELIDSPGGYPAATATSPRNEKDALVGNTVETGAIYGSQGCKMIIGASLRGEDTRDCRPGHKLPGPLLAGCKCYTMRENVKDFCFAIVLQFRDNDVSEKPRRRKATDQ